MNSKNILVYPKYPRNLHRLYQIAQNLWCTWNYDAINLFYRIDAKLFKEVSHNPVRFLHSLSRERLEALSADRGFCSSLKRSGSSLMNICVSRRRAKGRKGRALRQKAAHRVFFNGVWSA